MTLFFPELLTYSLPAIFVLRITVGIFFWIFGLRLLHAVWIIKNKSLLVKTLGFIYGISKLIIGVMLVAGVYTQIVLLFGMFLTVLTFFQGSSTQINKSGQQVQILLFIICLSLLFLGPGLLAIDLPL